MICALITHIAAMHFGTAQHYRTMIPGAGLECQVADSVSVAVGGYKNSEGDRSTYLVAAKDWNIVGPVSAGVFLGTINGYKWRNDGNWDYFGGIETKIKLTEDFAIRAQLIPRPDPNTKAVIGIGVSYNFNVGE